MPTSSEIKALDLSDTEFVVPAADAWPYFKIRKEFEMNYEQPPEGWQIYGSHNFAGRAHNVIRPVLEGSGWQPPSVSGDEETSSQTAKAAELLRWLADARAEYLHPPAQGQEPREEDVYLRTQVNTCQLLADIIDDSR